MHNIVANGASIPALGFGTFRMSGAEVAEVLPAALAQGFRHVDTAQIYGNEDAVGAAIAASGVARDQIFLTTKVWVTNFAADRFAASVEESLTKLGTDHVDLLLLHWPGGSDVPRAVQIDQLNRVQARGLTRHIGVSNYSIAQMNEAVRLSDAPLVTNQVEYHPYLSQAALLDAALARGMSLTAYYSLADGKVAQDPMLQEIGRAHGKTAAQVALRWLIQQPGVAALTKTARIARLPENFGIFDFELNETEMAAIYALARPDGRLVSPEGLAPIWTNRIWQKQEAPPARRGLFSCRADHSRHGPTKSAPVQRRSAITLPSLGRLPGTTTSTLPFSRVISASLSANTPTTLLSSCSTSRCIRSCSPARVISSRRR